MKIFDDLMMVWEGYGGLVGAKVVMMANRADWFGKKDIGGMEMASRFWVLSIYHHGFLNLI